MNINKFILSHELILIVGFILIFIGIRSIYFTDSLNFSADQGNFSIKAMEIYKNHSLVLIGPSFSVNLNGRYAFQGSIIYYELIAFLVMGGFDPVISSYIFMLFCAITIIPLYIGTKLLINKQAAILMLIGYTLIPFYINYSKFLWNPNFQFSLLPFLILLIGLYKHTNKKRYMFFMAVFGGVIVQFHYQLMFILASILIYYLITEKYKFRVATLIMTGYAIGFAPMIIFELRHNFYNLLTIIMFFKYGQNVGNAPTQVMAAHYFLSSSLFALLLLLGIFRNTKLPVKTLFISLFVFCLLIYIPRPTQGFGMPSGWKYLNEMRVFEIIKSNNLQNFNVLNLIYDTKASVQKYLLAKNHININSDNYLNNNFLFVIASDYEFLNTKSYEIKQFDRKHVAFEWKITDKYNLYLLDKNPLGINVN